MIKDENQKAKTGQSSMTVTGSTGIWLKSVAGKVMGRGIWNFQENARNRRELK